MSAVVIEDLDEIIRLPLPFEDLAGRTVLISGVNGFLPACMAETLLHLNDRKGLGIRVIGLARNREKAEKRFARHRDRSDLQLLIRDVCEPLPAPTDTKDRADYVIHAASQASPKHYGVDPAGTMLPNIVGTANLLGFAAASRSTGFLYFSSSEVYGEVDAGIAALRETDRGLLDPMNVRSCYAESKRAGETLCVSWQRQHGVPIRVVRPFHTYGPGMALDDGRVFSDFVSDIIHHRDIRMRSDGSAVRAYCYLADAVAGFFTVLLKGAAGEAYNVGNDRAAVSVVDLAERLAGLFPERKLRVVREEAAPSGYIPSPVSRSCPDITKLAALGWTPRHSIESGFKRTIASYERENAE